MTVIMVGYTSLETVAIRTQCRYCQSPCMWPFPPGRFMVTARHNDGHDPWSFFTLKLALQYAISCTLRASTNFYIGSLGSLITQTGFMATMSAAVIGSTLPQNGAVSLSIIIGQDGRGKGSLRVKMAGSVG